MFNSKVFLLLIIVGSGLFSCSSNTDKYELWSPNKQDKLVIFEDEIGWNYSYEKNGVPIIEKSKLGLELNEDVLENLTVIDAQTDTHQETWETAWGYQKTIINNYNELAIHLKGKGEHSRFSFICRMFDEGLAFKYEVNTGSLTSSSLKKELTEFKISGDSECWMLNHPWGKKYKAGVSIEKVENASLPLLSKSSQGKYTLITEAELYNYGSLHLTADSIGVLAADIIGDVKFKNQFSSPWRVIMAADYPAYFVERSYLVQNLNAPSKIKDVSWIKPGICTWDWRARGAVEGDFEYELNTESLIRFVDKTAELGLPYFMVDAGWYGKEHERKSDPFTAINEIDMELFMKRAKDKNIGVWLYVNRLAFEEFDVDKLLTNYKKWGVVGIKLGFLKEMNQWGVELLQTVLEKCAEYQIMFDCHEAVIPSGIERTWPHFFTREYNHSLEDGRYIASPVDHTITPFLNNVAGPIDVTPGFFDIDKLTERKYVREELKSTVVAQAAMCVTYFSPLLCLPDIPEAYQRKSDLFEFIKSLPLTYNESKVLIGDIEKQYVIARRTGEDWWIGGVCNEDGTRFKLPLDFLGEGNYRMKLFVDGQESNWKENREVYSLIEKEISHKETLDLRMASGGGLCISLEKIKNLKETN